MNISYDYYKVFYYVCKYESFTQAANVLMNNQPNVTRIIKNLEGELGCTLFERSNKGVKLTDEGQMLYEHISTAIEQIQIGEQELSMERTLQSGVVLIGVSEVALRCFLLPILQRYHKAYPGVKLKISNYSTPQAISALRKGLVDIAVVTTPMGNIHSLKADSICQIQETAVCGYDFIDLVSKEISLEEISQYPIISLSPQTKTYEFYRDWFMKNGLPFNPDIEVETADLILPMAENNLGIGFVPEPFLKNAGERIIRLRLKENIPVREICCIKRSNHSLSIAAKELERMMTEDMSYKS